MEWIKQVFIFHYHSNCNFNITQKILKLKKTFFLILRDYNLELGIYRVRFLACYSSPFYHIDTKEVPAFSYLFFH